MNGSVLNIQRFCTSDGPGIRTTVFLKGCPLKCIWCHNPESQRRQSELLYDAEKCLRCGRCVDRCPRGCHVLTADKHTFLREACVSCGGCLSPLCSALERSGDTCSADEVITEVLKDRAFYESSGGGMTLSGGEPLSQTEFAEALLRSAKEQGIHTAIETCGYAPTEVIRRTAEWVDLYLFDVKETDPALHKSFTGVDNALILKNLRELDALGKPVILRCPVIPECNDREDHFVGIAELANRLNSIVGITVEPYHTLGTAKYARLGREYALPIVNAPDEETVNRWITEIQSHTAVKVSKA